MQRLGKLLMQFDSFATDVGFVMEGERTFKSKFGTMLSFVIFAITLSYGAMKFEVVNDRSDTTYQTIVQPIDLHSYEVLPQDETNF